MSCAGHGVCGFRVWAPIMCPVVCSCVPMCLLLQPPRTKMATCSMPPSLMGTSPTPQIATTSSNRPGHHHSGHHRRHRQRRAAGAARQIRPPGRCAHLLHCAAAAAAGGQLLGSSLGPAIGQLQSSCLGSCRFAPATRHPWCLPLSVCQGLGAGSLHTRDCLPQHLPGICFNIHHQPHSQSNGPRTRLCNLAAAGSFRIDVLLAYQPLQAQAAALVSRFGVNPQVESVMRQLWLALLPRTGILEPNYYMR